MSGFDLRPYPIVLAEDINSMFTKIEHSTDFICSKDIAARSCWPFQQCAINLTRFSHVNETDSKLTVLLAGCCY